jgi:hypothetical protein
MIALKPRHRVLLQRPRHRAVGFARRVDARAYVRDLSLEAGIFSDPKHVVLPSKV